MEVSTILLHGAAPEPPEGTIVQVCSVELQVLDNVFLVSWPPEIQQLLEEFGELFEVPVDLPPIRACDHAIFPCFPGLHKFKCDLTDMHRL